MTRRELLTDVPLLVAAAPGAPALESNAARRAADDKPYDLLIKRGKVIDPAQGLEAVSDVAIRNGKIAGVDANIPLEQAREVIERATANAARVFSFGAEIGTLKTGTEADVSVLEVREGKFALTDSDGKTRTARQKLDPVVTVRGGKLFPPA
jgi:predicted amidohydrolase